MSTTYIIIAVLITHFVIGFGFLIYKLSPKKGDKQAKDLKNN